MKKLLRNLLVVAAGVVMIPGAHAGVITWGFTGSTSATSYDTAVFASAPSLAPSLNASGNPKYSVGSGLLTYSYNGNQVNGLNSANFIITIGSPSGGTISGLSVQLANTQSGMTSLDGQWSYQVGTGGYTSFGSSINLMANGTGTDTFLPSAVTLGPGQTLQLAFTLSNATGATSGNGQNISFSGLEVDYTTFSPVPEPVHYALAGFGFIFVGAGAGRWCYRWKKSA